MANKLQYNPSTIFQQGDKIGTYHLADNPNLYEPQRTNNFELLIMNIDGITRAGMTGTEASDVRTIPNAQEILRLSCSQAFVPHYSQSVIEVKRGNSTLKYAGVPTFQNGQVIINDYIGASAKEALMAWQNLSYNVTTEKVGLAQDYKKDCKLLEYSPDYQLVRTWVLHGCWISSITEGNYDSNSNNMQQCTATIEYDRAEIDTSSEI